MTSQGTLKSEKYTKLGEQIFISLGIFGGFLVIIGYEFKPVYFISLTGLSVTYFISAFHHLDFKSSEDKQFGFSELFVWTILPKVLWISISIVILGVLFFYAGFGYQELLILGTSTIIISMLLLTVFVLKGVKQLNVLLPLLYRVMVYLIGGLFILFYFSDNKFL